MVPANAARGAALRVRLVASVGVAAVTVAVYSVGATRSFGYDAAVTVQHFVRTPSIWDPWRRAVVFNNHPLLSFLDRLLFAATGSASEPMMRAIPIAAAGAAVGLSVWLLSGRWSTLGATIGGLLVAVNPTMATRSRDVRGYSLMVLCSVVCAGTLVRDTKRDHFVYGVALTAGALTHIYTLALVPCHAAYLLGRRRPMRPWVKQWALAAIAGALALLPALGSLGARGRLFRPDFPATLARAALGGVPLAVAATLVLVAAGLGRLSARLPEVLVGVFLVLAVWLYGPFDLYPRFFLWAVPLLAVAVAVAVDRAPRLAWVGGLAVLLTLGPQLGSLRQPELANRSGARLLATVRRPCAMGWSTEGMGPYRAPRVRQVDSPTDLVGCDAALVLKPAAHGALVAAARRRFSRTRRLRAATGGLLFTSPRASGP
jgi:hypothetical protein